MAKKVSPPITPDPAGDLAFLAENIKKPEKDPVAQGLSKYLAKRWATIHEDYRPIRRDMVRIMRRVRGEYAEEKLRSIKAFRGSEIYLRVCENKARAAVSWIKDIYRGDTDLPWQLEPTAIPDIPGETLENIQAQTKQKAAQMEQDLIASGAVVNRYELASLMQKYYDQELDKERQRIEQEAKEKCNLAAKEIRDQGQEGGWNTAFSEFLYYFVRLKLGIIKGPNLVKKQKQVWGVNEQTGEIEIQTVDAFVNDVYSVSPFNFFPQRDMSSINDGDVFEIHELSPETLYSMIDVAGYSADEINLVLSKFERGELKEKWFQMDDETIVNKVTKQVKADSGREEASLKSKQRTRILAQEFHGTVSGKLLMEWGVPGQLEMNRQYQANCWKIDEHVIKAVINPDPLGRKPYHVSSWAKNPAWIVGEGLIEFGGPIEDAMNAVMRALQNNIAMASGPMAEVDKDRVETTIPIYPWRQIESTSLQMKSQGPAVNYYQPQMHAQELTLVYSFLGKLLDEMTVPAYAQGASQAGVTTGTATVFTSLLAAAARAIKAVVANIDDDVITPYITMCYDENMRNTKDPSTKGDARVVAKGVAGLLAKEQQAQRKIEYLQVVANPTYQQMLGEKNIGAILLQLAQANDIKLPDVNRLEGKMELSAVLEEMLRAQAGLDPMQMNGQMGAGGGAPAQGQGMNPDGSKAGVNNG